MLNVDMEAQVAALTVLFTNGSDNQINAKWDSLEKRYGWEKAAQLWNDACRRYDEESEGLA